MSAIQVRGYMLASTTAYLRDTLGDEGSKHLIAGLSPPLQQAIAMPKPAMWYPADFLAELNRATATALGKGDDNRARQAFIDCGKYMAREATNTFLRLLMRMLTPSLFAKKLPDFWARDISGGRLSVEVNDEKLDCHYSSIAGLDHTPVVGAGFATFALETMGKSIEKTTIRNWSLTNPAAEGASFELIWKQ